MSNILLSGINTRPILQIIQFTTNGGTTTSSSTFVDTSLTLSITPKLSTSTVLVIASGMSTSPGTVGWVTLARNGTNILNATYGAGAIMNHGSGNTDQPQSLAWHDSPATTSATTYTVRIRTNSGASSVTFPSGSCTGMIVAIEIGA